MFSAATLLRTRLRSLNPLKRVHAERAPESGTKLSHSQENAASESGEPFSMSAVNLEGFLAELDALRKEVDGKLGQEDLDHLAKMERWGRTASAIGWGLAWFPNPISPVALAIGRTSRWITMHHVGHKGYDKVPGVRPERTSRVFAKGWRRMLDWPDWMVPEAWNFEHNILHHGATGEERDPDLVERNVEWIHKSDMSQAKRYLMLAGLFVSWKFTYYAPNTLRVLTHKHLIKQSSETTPPVPRKDLWLKCYLPYGAINFVAIPALFAPLGPFAVASAVFNSVVAEAIENVHTFAIIGPNHSGDDMYRFTTRPKNRAESYVRQIIGSANYQTGSEAPEWARNIVDFLQGYLNYQIEHHIWADLPMLRYQELQPKVKALCAKYGVPYVQENVFARVKKMSDIVVGNTTMRVLDGEAAERAAQHDGLAAAAE